MHGAEGEGLALAEPDRFEVGLGELGDARPKPRGSVAEVRAMGRRVVVETRMMPPALCTTTAWP